MLLLKSFILLNFSPLAPGFRPGGEVCAGFMRVSLAQEGFSGNWPPAEITFSITFFFSFSGFNKLLCQGAEYSVSNPLVGQGVLPAYVRRDPLNCAESS